MSNFLKTKGNGKCQMQNVIQFYVLPFASTTFYTANHSKCMSLKFYMQITFYILNQSAKVVDMQIEPTRKVLCFILHVRLLIILLFAVVLATKGVNIYGS